MTASLAAAGGCSVLPPVPPPLAARGIALRPEEPGDRPFLRDLYISFRWEELAVTPWPDDAKRAFLTQQFQFQTTHYTTHYPGAAFGIITDHDRPVGRLYLHQGHDLRIMDISLAPSHRGQGIGGALIQAVFALGEQAGTSVSIHVEVFNHQARRLYDRLGFVEGDNNGAYCRMDWAAPPRTASA